jgi:hypothetical protein
MTSEAINQKDAEREKQSASDFGSWQRRSNIVRHAISGTK